MTNQTIVLKPGDSVTITTEPVSGPPPVSTLRPYVMNSIPSHTNGLPVAGPHVRVRWNQSADLILAYADQCRANGQTMILSLGCGNPGDIWLPSGYTSAGKALYLGAWQALLASIDRHPAIHAYQWSFGEWDDFMRDYSGQDKNAYFNAYLEGWIALCNLTKKPVTCQPSSMSNYYRYWLLNSYRLPSNAHIKMTGIQAHHLYPVDVAGKAMADYNLPENLGQVAALDYTNSFGQHVNVAMEPKNVPSTIAEDDAEVIATLKSCQTFVDVQEPWLALLKE